MILVKQIKSEQVSFSLTYSFCHSFEYLISTDRFYKCIQIEFIGDQKDSTFRRNVRIAQN